MKSIYTGLLAALLLASCQKADLPENIEQTPVFSATFTSGPDSQTLVAGLDGRYLFTSFDRDAHDVVTMRGAFAQSDCPNADCPGTLIFEFRNYAPGAVLPIPNDTSVIKRGNYAFRSPSADSMQIIHRLTFTAIDQDPGAFYSWTILQQSQLVVEAAGPSLTHEFINAAPLSVNFSYSKPNGFSGSSSTEYRFDQSICPQVSIHTTPDTLGLLFSEVNPPGGNYEYQWSTGDSTPVIAIDTFSAGLYYALTVTNDNGCIGSASINNPFAGVEVNRLPLIDIASQDSIISNPLQLGTVALQWIQSETGQVFRSDLGQQPADSYFIVTDAGYYEPNEKGEKTNRLWVQYRCWLFNADGGARPFEGSATIAVAYP